MTDQVSSSTSDRLRLDPLLPRLTSALFKMPFDITNKLEIERQFEAGQSNPTYLLRSGQRRLVLRKQPYGNLLPRAHDVIREHKIISALHASGFPVPKPLLAVEDHELIGTSFFLMDFVEGNVESDPILPNRSIAERQTIYRNIAETLANLHKLDPIVLESANVRFRPQFTGRQVNLWHAQYLASQTETDERVDRIAHWLLDNLPVEMSPSIVHGDYRIENFILRDSTIGAVLDWELCAIGEPLCDLSYCCMWYHLPRDVLGGLKDVDFSGLGIPEEREFIDIYSARSGIDGLRSRSFFMAFSFYRLAAILQGVYKRGIEGNASSPFALTRGHIARLCLDRAEKFAGG
jgi:aminoglycoside phosphotransferase (APT) family kinase protein